MSFLLNKIRILNSIRLCTAKYCSKSELPSEGIFFTDNNMVICWHPEKPFPYEYTLPLPEEKIPDTNSILKVSEKEISAVFRKKKQQFIVEDLAKITFTEKHRWYPRSRDKRAKKTEPDRRYL